MTSRANPKIFEAWILTNQRIKILLGFNSLNQAERALFKEILRANFWKFALLFDLFFWFPELALGKRLDQIQSKSL